MVLIYVANKRIGEVSELASRLQAEEKQFGYRNPKLFEKPEKCDAVYIHGNYPAVAKAYEGMILEGKKTSSDFTVKEVAEKAAGMTPEELAAFTKGDERAGVKKLLDG